MRIRRREFLAGASALAATSTLARAAAAFQASDAEILYEWYRQNFFDFDRAFNAAERAYVARISKLEGDVWGYDVDGQFEYSMITFSHRVSGSKVNSSRVAFCSVNHGPALRPQIADVLRSRGIDPNAVPEINRAVGLGWDFEADHLKVYAFERRMSEVRDPEMKALIARVDEPHHATGYVCTTFTGARATEKKVYLAMKERLPRRVDGVPFADQITHTNYMVTSSRGVVPQVDLQQPSRPKGLSSVGQAIIDRYGELRESVDTVAFGGTNNFTLYFP